MKAGDVFNPSRKACGFYPPDVYAESREDGDGPKRLYERLVRWAGTKGYCWHPYGNMADALGKCKRQVIADMQTLVERGLIRIESRGKKGGGRGSNLYRFLWHPMFANVQDSAPLTDGPNVQDSAPLTDGPEEEIATAHKAEKQAKQPDPTGRPPSKRQENAAKNRMVTMLSTVRGLCRGAPEIDPQAIRNCCSPEEIETWADIANKQAGILDQFAAKLEGKGAEYTLPKVQDTTLPKVQDPARDRNYVIENYVNGVENSRSPSVSKREAAIEVWFEEKFWPAYPRKAGRALALKIARRVAKSPEKREAIMAGLERHLPDLQSREQRFVPHAATWLHQERWRDEPEALRPSRPLNAVEALYQ